MAASNAATSTVNSLSTDEKTAKAVHKRNEGLVMVRTKAIKGKGAWYWAHLELVLLHTETGLPRTVKLRCSLCDAVFSASNPSRTTSEHLKRGTCPNFNSLAKPIFAISPPTHSSSTPHGITLNSRHNQYQKLHINEDPQHSKSDSFTNSRLQ